ncbi:thioredoxin family protein, partial [Lentilactobacillus hilgardii]|uniref:thioredoxin family protein n=1 Tax=Lentilactobacillus hilgardii TaxID=1588 RepID=UPI0039EA33EC
MLFSDKYLLKESAKMIKEIHDQDFAKETDTGIAVIDFRADWCPPCRMMDPILKSLSE